MKELSIEEKAKRYDEAINKMKHYVVDEYGCSRIKVADVFLELEEGENIRIIKAIEYGLDYVFTNNTTVFEVTKEQCLAWLEKQGQKPAAWSEEDNNMLKWVIGYLNNKMLNAPISEERTACKNAIAWLEKQGEQKSVDFSDLRTWKYIVDAVWTEKEGIGQYLDSPFTEEVAKKLQKRFGNIEQKPTDIQSIEKRAHEVFPDDNDANTPFYRQAFIDGAVDYIDCGCKKSSAWSKEDDQYLLICKNALAKYQVSDKWDACIISHWLENKIKSLRPQNRWKPSDEQLEYLAAAIEESNENPVLDSLYQDLKKLRDE